MKHYFINLTNGIEAIPELEQKQIPYSFIRIQSTACEQHRYSQMILDLDYNFLMNAALGNECIVYDFGANKEIPRAMYQGLEFIKFVLYRYWFKTEYVAEIRKSLTSKKYMNVTKYFYEEYKKLDKKVFKKLDYFRPYLTGKGVQIEYIAASTTHGSDKEYYVDIFKNLTSCVTEKYTANDIRFAC